MSLIVWDCSRGTIKKASRRDLYEVIYMLTSLIPTGRVVSYKNIATILGLNPRIIGIAMRKNKNPIITPCHRVVGSKGDLRGYSLGGVKMKKKILEIEGVVFRNNRVDYRFFIDLAKLLEL